MTYSMGPLGEIASFVSDEGVSGLLIVAQIVAAARTAWNAMGKKHKRALEVLQR
jgi:hypothetical protein